MDETCRQFVLQLMQPMLREFKKTLSEMRDQGHTDAEIAATLDRIELDNCGKLEKEILDAMMSELRLAAGIPPPVPCCRTQPPESRRGASSLPLIYLTRNDPARLPDQALSRLRPRRRRAATTLRPPLVAMRARKP